MSWDWLGNTYNKQPSRGDHSGEEDMFYGHGRTSDWGAQGGFGLQSPEHNVLGGRLTSDLLTGSGFAGGRVEDDGSVTHGSGAAGQVGGLDMNWGEKGSGGHYGGLDVDVLGAGVEASLNMDKGATVGASAYVAQAKGTLGNIGTTVGGDSEVGFGLAYGVGAAGRLHWEDADNDGYREYGFGFDAGPVSFDYKGEDPLRDLMGVSCPGILGDSNLTHSAADVADFAGDTWDSVSDGASSAWDLASDTASDVSDFAGDTWDTVSSGASSAWDTVSSGASDAVDWVGDTASSVGSSISSGVGAAASWIGGVFSGW
jgi:hypothetical protein